MTSKTNPAMSPDEGADIPSSNAQSIHTGDDGEIINYLCVKTDDAQKLGRSGGFITYKILTDSLRQNLYLTVVANDRGGYWSREVVDFAAIERCLPADRRVPISAKVFIPSFKGRSVNDPTFMAACLRAIGLLGPVENRPYLHAVVGDWDTWKESMLSVDGVVYVPQRKGSEAVMEDAGAITSEPAPAAPDADVAVPVRKSRTLKLPKTAGGDKHARSA